MYIYIYIYVYIYIYRYTYITYIHVHVHVSVHGCVVGTGSPKDARPQGIDQQERGAQSSTFSIFAMRKDSISVPLRVPMRDLLGLGFREF